MKELLIIAVGAHCQQCRTQPVLRNLCIPWCI